MRSTVGRGSLARWRSLPRRRSLSRSRWQSLSRWRWLSRLLSLPLARWLLLSLSLWRVDAVAAPRPEGSSLARSPSPYLREAASSKVRWRGWNAATLAEAKRARRPILVDVGAGWCHWCHVMDETTYADPEVARAVNESYLAVKIDRDLSPDLDAHFQSEARRLGSNGGWPLTVWLSPDGAPLHAATYVPALEMRAELARWSTANSFQRAPGPATVAAPAERPGAIDAALADRIGAALLATQDPVNGGRASRSAKFPDGGAIQFALELSDRRGEAGALFAFATRTLDGIARGGMRDHVGGGFHRYSTDPTWSVPHFEKMSYVNAALLAAFTDGWRASGDERWREAATETIEFLLGGEGGDTARGGFFASEDADSGPGDDGAFFTWTLAELRAAGGEEAVRFFGAGASVGVDRRIVLRESRAALHPRPLILRLRATRSQRRHPRIDTTKFASWNGMVIEALLEAAAVFDLPGARAAARRALDFLVAHAPGVHALTALGRVASPANERRLDDAAWLLRALIEGYESTGRESYLAAAKALASATDRALWDDRRNAYRESTDPLAAVASIDDDATPSPSAVMAIALSRLAALTGQRAFADRAELLLATHAVAAEEAGAYASTYGRALLEHTAPRIHAVVVSARKGDPMASQLRQAVLAAYRPSRVVRSLDAVASKTSPYRPGPHGEARVYVCGASSCAPPTGDAAEAKRRVERWER